MSEEILKYVLLLIFLLVVFALMMILRGGINVRNSGGFSRNSNPISHAILD